MMSRVSYSKIIELLLPLRETGNLAPCDYNILISSLIEAGHIEEGKRVLERLISLSKQHNSRRIHSEVALLSIALDNAEAAVEFSSRSGSVWLQQYVSALYGTSKENFHDSLVDRQTERSTSSDAINLALLDYKSPLEYAINDNIGDHIQSLSVMRHIARFYTDESFLCNDSLKDVFRFLAESWNPEERSQPSAPLNMVIMDRDCARTDRTVWLPFFGWFGKYPLEIPMTFPLPANIRPIFFSFHLNDIRMLTPGLRDYLKCYEPIGCRDKNTRDWLASAGVEAFFTGCVTTTLDLSDDAPIPASVKAPYQRGERYQVDDIGEDIPGAIKLTHLLDSVMEDSFTHNIERSLDILLAYKQALSVSTSRLHCYLPCRALGTPVTFNAHSRTDIRFEGLVDISADELGVMSAELTELLNRVFSLIFSGADAKTVYSAWREMTLPLVERDSLEREAYPKLFNRNGSQSATDARMEDHIPIALAFDRNLLEYVPNLMRSIQANTSKETAYHLLVRGISDRDMENMESMFPGQTINWHPMDRKLTDVGVTLQTNITISTMDRLLLPDLLPSIDKILYLDIDMIVLGDVSELYSTPLGGHPLAAVPEVIQLGEYLERHTLKPRKDPREICALRAIASAAAPLHRPVFNAGALIMSLEALRGDQFTAQAVRNMVQFGLDDQAQINLYAYNDIIILPDVWNVNFARYHIASSSPSIVHWVGIHKPWMKSLEVKKTKHLWEHYSRK